MKKAAMFILKYISITAAFFSAGALILILMALCGIDSNAIGPNILIQILIISVLFAVTSPISFSVRHFIKHSLISRLLIQTAVNYPILIICSVLFGWITSANDFYKITTIYFFAGLAASLFICIYYPRKYNFYNDRLRAYKKRALFDEYPDINGQKED